jgi:hypothetical protein
MPRTIEAQCTECKKPVTLTAKGKIDAYHRSGRTYCSDPCRDTWVARDRSERMVKTNRKHASRRMTDNNPMSSAASRAKMTKALTGHPPQVRGGNGRGPTVPQKTLADLLGWPMEVAVPLGRPRVPGRPTNYKLDLANLDAKVAIEIDGHSHNTLAARERDQRKDAWLTGAGWTVLRFTNEEVTADPAACARAATAVTKGGTRS